ncbi:uncharacterized protein LOC143018872 isoform X2 [Oratosquilla oratoria]|uniref:uncharacterized protein LOC143018872 isoform X2 n=1 Tax=Oratosquilla oratoria TaxID=337810 RepID=UPI003F771CD8
MNFLYYKNFHEEKTPTHIGYKKKKDIRKVKGNQNQHGIEGHPQNCECEYCTNEFPLRTHLLLDMSYSRLEQDHMTQRKPAPSSGTKFSFFWHRKKSASHRTERLPIPTRVLLPAQEPVMAPPQGPHPLEHVTISTLKQDCFMIPVSKMTRFFPAGHPIPTQEATGRLRLLETQEPDIHVVFHMMGPPTPVAPALMSPLNDPHAQMREAVVKAFRAGVGAVSGPSGSVQGMVLLNLERDGELGAVEFSFMIVWVVDGRMVDWKGTIQRLRQASLEALDPAKTGYHVAHYFDRFDEVATLARPPIEKLSRKATTPSTGYIISVFKVFQGDDGQKFERNWLGWTGARTLYKSLTADVGLRRLTLHKSAARGGVHHYVLLCDCANFLTNIANAVKAIPRLRMRLCGDTALYRPISTV